jgi:hypothetical protein
MAERGEEAADNVQELYNEADCWGLKAIKKQEKNGEVDARPFAIAVSEAAAPAISREVRWRDDEGGGGRSGASGFTLG